MGYTIDNAVKMLSTAGVTSYELCSSQERDSQVCTKWKTDNLSNAVFLDVFIVAVHVRTNFITESYQTILLSHINDGNKRQEIILSDS
jgi:hypothetical protein